MNEPKNEESRDGLTRRGFIGGAAAAGGLFLQACEGGFHILPRKTLGGRIVPPSEKVNIGIIGAGGKGFDDLQNVASENIVALCDVDEERAAEARKKYPDVPFYHDFREMLDKEKSLDAVTVSTPDHTHYVAASAAIRRGLHVYCQKPLTHDIAEARSLRTLARVHKVQTQMGNQGTAENGLRESVEIVRSGALGPVRQVHVWTNRPVWPQGIARPSSEPPVPKTLNWDLWLGTAAARPYHPFYLPFKWRGWYDFGTGALGDMACHTANLPFLALNLEYPTSIEAQTGDLNNDSYPKWSVIKFEFPARGEMPPLTFTWYDGGKMPPDDLLKDIKAKKSGMLMVGDKGMLYSPDDYGEERVLLPEKDFAGYVPPKPTLPRSPGHYKEWIDACKGGPAPMSNFDYAGLLTESILLGNLAVRTGKKIEWDGEKMESANVPEANTLLKREYRKGWEF